MNIYIRPLKEEDAYSSYIWRNDPEVFKFTGNVYTNRITIESELNWIRRVMDNNDEYRCAIMADDEYIGNIYLTGINDCEAWFHIFIGNKDYWGKGIAKKASLLMLDHAFNILKIKTVRLSVHPDNLSAINLYSSIGYKETGMCDNRIIMEISK